MVTSKNFGASSLAMQRASIDAAAALTSSGNSRDTKRTLPASIYLVCSVGNTFSANAAQCGQVREEYSMTVIGAVTDPIAMSGRPTGFAANAAMSLSGLGASGEGDPDQAREARSERSRREPRVGRMATDHSFDAGPACAFARCGCRTERLEPDGVQVHAAGHQAERHHQTEARQHRDRLERAIGSNRSNQLHDTPLFIGPNRP